MRFGKDDDPAEKREDMGHEAPFLENTMNIGNFLGTLGMLHGSVDQMTLDNKALEDKFVRAQEVLSKVHNGKATQEEYWLVVGGPRPSHFFDGPPSLGDIRKFTIAYLECLLSQLREASK